MKEGGGAAGMVGCNAPSRPKVESGVASAVSCWQPRTWQTTSVGAVATGPMARRRKPAKESSWTVVSDLDAKLEGV
jgi:hypothetical protein